MPNAVGIYKVTMEGQQWTCLQAYPGPKIVSYCGSFQAMNHLTELTGHPASGEAQVLCGNW